MSETRVPQPLAFDAVILAGGRGSRLGGVSKADLIVGGVRLLDRVLDAAAGARTTVVVGTAAVPPGVHTTMETPPGSGPAAGLAAGLAAIADPAPLTLILAVDLPDAATAVAALHAASAEDPDADYAIRGSDGQPEWLLGLYRTSSLHRALAAYGDPRNRSIRGLLRPLGATLVGADTHDLDTWADHAHWNARLRRKERTMSEDRSAWRPFIDRACQGLGVDPALVDEDAILTMTREVAHAGARPMAPISAYILGLAVGNGGDADYLRRVLEDAVTAAPIPEEN